MSIESITKGIRGLQQLPKVIEAPGMQGPQSGKAFGEVLTDALREVDDLQKAADQQIEGVSLGKDGFTSHGAAIALEKADVAFQLMNTIRSKIIRAYEEVIRTQV